MVYHGIPSKACGLCRSRKIKCDQLRPACSQCVRVAAKCPGYRNLFDLIFRDQTLEMEQKSRRAATPQLFTTDSATISVTRKPYLIRSISPSVRELVIPLFFHYFAVEDTTSGHALLSCLPQTISTAGDDALSAAVLSVGYSILANITNSSDKLIMARQKYGIAVRLTYNALQKSVPSETCQIVRIIVLLAFFEVFTCKDPQSMRTWSSHLDGAATLFGARGVDISNCTLGRKGLKLHLQLRSQTLTNSLQRNLPFPNSISQLSKRVKKFMTPDELLSTELGDIMIRLANFRASMAAEDSFGASQPVEILLQIDSDLEEWARALPLSWRHEVQTCVPRDDFYTTFYHKYQGFSIAAVWNQYRIARCLVSDHLLSYLDSSRSANQACDPFVLLKQCDQARTTIRKLCIDICASVPYFLCQRDQNDPPRPGVGALEVMWALFTCARMYCIPEEQRLWAIVQLDKIGHEMAVRLALSLANLIRLKGNPLESGSVFDPAWENCISINT